MDNNEKITRESEFYSSPFKFSYSSLNKLMYAPSVFYKEYVLKMREVRTDAHLVEGKIIHYLLLDSANFKDKFIIASSALPTGNTKDVIDIVYELSDKSQDLDLFAYRNEILETLKQINLHQKLVDDKKPDANGIMLSGDDKRLAKIITAETQEYFNFLKVKEGKDIISADTLEKCTRAAEALSQNEQIRELLGLNRTHDDEAYGIYNELEVSQEGEPFGLKGIIDNMTVDVANKKVTINDLKTSSKTIAEFPESVDYWNYWMQAAVYRILAKEFLKDVIDSTWVIEFNFIVVDKYNQVYAFGVSKSTLNDWNFKLKECLKKAHYHYVNKDYTLPFEFAVDKVLL
jgi:hypothetical protein